MVWDWQVDNALLRFLSCTGLIEAVLVAMIKAAGAQQVFAWSTMSTEQRARVKVLSWVKS